MELLKERKRERKKLLPSKSDVLQGIKYLKFNLSSLLHIQMSEESVDISSCCKSLPALSMLLHLTEIFYFRF